MPGGRAEQPADGGNLAGTLRLCQQIGGGAAVVFATGAKTRTLEQHHQRDPIPQREFGQSVALGVPARADAAGQRGEVLGTHHHRRPVDQAGAGDNAVGRDLAADEGAELPERPLVQQVIKAATSIQFALAVVLGQAFPAPHAPGVLTAAREFVEGVLPVLGSGHSLLLSR